MVIVFAWISALMFPLCPIVSSCSFKSILPSTVTGGGLLGLHFGNLLLLIFTLGFAWPWVVVRSARYQYTHLTLEGALDLSAIQQEAQTSTAIGEGLDELLELDTGFAA